MVCRILALDIEVGRFQALNFDAEHVVYPERHRYGLGHRVEGDPLLDVLPTSATARRVPERRK